MSAPHCERCAANQRPGVPATTHQEYREAGDYDHWPNRSRESCDRCAQALRDYCKLPSISSTILVDVPLGEVSNNA